MFMLLALSLGSPGALRETQTLLLIRHGRTQMNEHLAQPGKEMGAPNFEDPAYYDTELTELGQAQARELHGSFRDRRYPPVDTLISSPLRRALHTSEIVFSGHVSQSITQRIVTPLAAERLFLSSDVGSPIDELVERFDPRWNIRSSLHDSWWHHGDPDAPEWRPPGTYVVPGEPQAAFDQRMRRLIEFLQDIETERGSVVALVCHAEVIQALTGKAVTNCACIEMPMTALPQEPFSKAH